MEELKNCERKELYRIVRYFRSISEQVAKGGRLSHEDAVLIAKAADTIQRAVDKAPRPYDQEWLPKLFREW